MKLLTLLSVFVTLALAGFAQPATPVKTNTGQYLNIAGKVGINGFPSLVQLATEGRAVSISTSTISTTLGVPSTATIAHGATIVQTSFSLQPGRAMFVTSTNAGVSSGPAEVSGVYAFPKPYVAFITNGQLADFKHIVGSTGGGYASSPMQLIGSEGTGTVVLKWMGAQGAPLPYGHATINGIEFTADFNWSAKRVIQVVGESTAWGTMGNDPAGVAYPKDSLWSFSIVNALCAEGKSTRHFNKAFGGANSMHINYAQRSGYLDAYYDLLIYNAQHNDKTNNTTEAQYKANLRAIIEHRNKWNKNASILFVSDFPQDVITDARNTNYRQWMQDVATSDVGGGGTKNKVYYVDCHDAYTLNATPANDLNMTERTAGTRLHPSGLGHRIIFRSKLWPAIKLTDFYTNRNNWN